ncbi:glycerate kinase [Topomyia yanbarensis]|uniref:glycerate kinase n=1 Tax=Topomyia yanbarensis TaxID=2498891 RepID=UPI00273C4811|nr:glycerate kinase [Topomyia yanbarensis]
MLWLFRNRSNLKTVGYRFQHHVTAAMHIALNALFLAAVDAVKPKALFENYLKNSEVSKQLQIPNKRYHLVGFGKAVLGMAVQMEHVLGDRLQSGCISIPVGTLERFKRDKDFQLSSTMKIKVFEGARNNLPDQDAVEAARMVKSLAESMTLDDVLCVIISGGGSALLSLPMAPVTLPEKLFVIKQLAAAGASIDELNTVRIQLSDVKGGKLALAAKNSYNLISFIVSDIIGDPISLIASGPTVRISSTNYAALKILEKYNLIGMVPKSIEQVLSSPEAIQTQDEFGEAHLIGSNKVAVDCIFQRAAEFGLTAMVISTRVQGNVEELCKAYITLTTAIIQFRNQQIDKQNFITQITQLDKILYFEQSKISKLVELTSNSTGKDILLVAGGEPTVVLQGTGIGGRNQELALRFGYECFQRGEILQNVVLLSAGTDGIDGPTDAAGAFGGANVIEQYIQQECIEPVEDFIKNNDSCSFYRIVRGGKYQIITGHTGTNVMDIHMLYIPKI